MLEAIVLKQILTMRIVWMFSRKSHHLLNSGTYKTWLCWYKSGWLGERFVHMWLGVFSVGISLSWLLWILQVGFKNLVWSVNCVETSCLWGYWPILTHMQNQTKSTFISVLSHRAFYCKHTHGGGKPLYQKNTSLPSGSIQTPVCSQTCQKRCDDVPSCKSFWLLAS